MTFTELSLSHSCVVLTEGLGLLSCWKAKCRPSLRSVEQVFIKHIHLYFAPLSFFSTLTSLPVPVFEKRPPSMMLPPPSLFGKCLISSPQIEHGHIIFFSPDQIMLFSRYFFPIFKQTLVCFALKRGFCLEEELQRWLNSIRDFAHLSY